MRTYEKLHVIEKPKQCILLYNVKGDINSKSRTQQDHAAAADINNIIAKYKENGILSSGDLKTQRKAIYGDFGNIDFKDSLEKITQIKNQFSMLSAEERAGYYNNPENWIKALEQKEILRIKTAQEATEAKIIADAKIETETTTEAVKTTETATTEENKEVVSQTS